MSNINKPFGLDYSRWQGTVDWDAVAINKRNVKFAGIRCTINESYVDPQGERNMKECVRVGINPAPYWVQHPNNLRGVKPQVDNFFNTLTKWGFDITKLYSVPDIELHAGVHKCSPEHWQRQLRDGLIYAEALSGVKPIIYSRASFIDHYVTGLWPHTPPAWLNNYDWWLAHYPWQAGVEHLGPPKLPKGVTREKCKIHQTTGSGTPFGVESKALDYNRWQFDQAHLDKYFDFGAAPVPPVIGCEAEVKRLKAGMKEVKDLTDTWAV